MGTLQDINHRVVESSEGVKSSQLLREAVASITQGFTIYDKNDRLVMCNEAYHSLYSISHDLKVLGNTFEEIVRQCAEQGQYVVTEGGIDEWVAVRIAQHQRADGKAVEQQLRDGRWVMVVEHEMPSGYIVGNHIDITNLKRVEAALRMREAKASQIFQNAPEAMLLVDASGRIKEVNHCTENLLGYGHGSLEGQSVEMLVPSELQQRHLHHREGYKYRPDARAMRLGRPLMCQRLDGRLFPAEVNLSPLDPEGGGLMIVTIIDITKRIQAQEMIEERNAQLDAIFQLAPDGLVSFDHEDRVKYVNPAFLHLTGLVSGKVIGLSLNELESCLRNQLESPDSWAGLTPCFTKAGEFTGEAPGQVGGENEAKEQAQQNLLALRQPHEVVLDIAGVAKGPSLGGRLLHVRDVTHEVEVDRLKSEFLSHAAHELRTPMASILGFSEILLEMELDEPTRRDLLETIHRQTMWLVDIINELLDLSRIEARRGKDMVIGDVELTRFIRATLDGLAIDTTQWHIETDLPSREIFVKTDSAKLRQALTNILGNAQKYSPNGGEIRVAVVSKAGQVGIQVTDSGIGMTPEEIARFGDRFWRADNSGKIPGTGLGVAIVKEILKLLGGSLEVSSKKRHGTTVILWLATDMTR